MSKINWPNTIAYGLFTALGLGLVIWFARFVSERTGAISWTLLIVGLTAATAILLYVFLRWMTGSLLDRARESLAPSLSAFGRRFESGAGEPVTREDMRAVQRDLEALVPAALRLGGVALTTLLLMNLLLQFVTLATSAVMYLQARRIEEQNVLLGAQNRGLDAAFLSESLASAPNIANNLRTIEGSAEGIESGLLSPMGILDAFVADQAGLRMEGFGFEPCPQQIAETCNALSFSDFSAMPVEEGRIVVTEANLEGIRGFHRLSRTIEAIGLAFFGSLTEPDASLNDGVAAGTQALADAITACGGDAEGRAIALWQGISGAGLAAAQMWPVDSAAEIELGDVFPFEDIRQRANFLGLGAGLGHLAQTTGLGELDTSGPQDLAKVFESSLSAFEEDLTALLDRCKTVRGELLQASEVLTRERSRVVRGLVSEAAASR